MYYMYCYTCRVMNGFCSGSVVGVVGGELGIMWMLEGSGNYGCGGGGASK